MLNLKTKELSPKSKGNETLPLEKNEKNTIYINESGLYSLILSSKLESTCVLSDGLPKMYCHPLERQEGTFMMT